ncbi:MAG: ABC transporter permease, partial [Anaerolineaceae bacterium]|nr:ABC transporter permease [Anaerolineaceae bacterium]
MRILELALKDLSQILRDKQSFLFLLAMPLIFTFVMGVALSGTTGSSEDRLTVAWVNPEPQSETAAILMKNLEASSAINLDISYTNADAAVKAVEDGKINAAIILPGGFDAAVLSGKQPLVSLTVKDGQTTTDTLQRIVQGALVKTISAVQTGQWVAGKVGEQRSLSAAESQQLIMNTAQDYNAAWLSSALKVELTPLSNPELVNKRNPYTQSSPGMIVQFVIFGLITCANIIVVERKSGTLDRLRTTSMGRAENIAGHMLAMFVLIFTQETILIVFGSLVLKVGYLSQPLATLVMMIAMAIWSASLGLLIGVLASKGGTGFMNQDDQVFVPLSTALYRLVGGGRFRGSSTISQITVKAASNKTVDKVVESVTLAMRELHGTVEGSDDFTVTSQKSSGSASICLR